MALSASKRRKIEHVSSEEDDEASFASFGDEDSAGEVAEDGEAKDLNSEQDEDVDPANDDEATEDVEDAVASGEEVEDDEDVSGDDGEEDVAANSVKERDRRRTAPSVNKAADGVYMPGTSKSNMFKLQVDELLEQIRPRRGKREETAEEALHALKKTIDQTTGREPLPIEEAERTLVMQSKVAVPFPEPRPPKDAKYKLEFAKPSSVNVVGSFALKTASRASGIVSIDMMVTMPRSLFQGKDYMDHRYFYKRAHYLACLAAALKEANSSTYDVQFENFHGDQLKPILVVTAKAEQTDAGLVKPIPKWRINILLCIDADTFCAEKLYPDKNCVRPAGTDKPEPTPLYNSSLRADMLVSSYLKLLHGATRSCEAFRDACLLGSTWLRQRGYGSDIAAGGFGNFEWAALIASLLQGGGSSGKPMLSGGYSSYQLFKATLQVLAMRDLSKQPLVVGSGTLKPVGDSSPVVWDAARAHNILYRVMPWAYSQLRQDATATLNMLGDQLYDGFDATFILRVDNPLIRYDYVVELSVSSIKSNSKTKLGREDGARKLYDTLKQGLGDRVSQLNLQLPSWPTWQLGSARPSAGAAETFSVGLVVHPDTANRTVDHGPSAESKSAAAAFRQFWGEKAELRRFKDGSILESLVWSPSEGGRSVLEQLVRYLLSKHFGADAESSAHFVGTGFSRMLRTATGTASFQPLMEAFKQMEADVRSLEALPLSVRQIMPADAQLRFSSISSPSGAAGLQQRTPANVTIQFEGSARWPDDLVAIQRTKIAFLLKLSEQLQESSANTTARIGLENQNDDILNQAFLDIIYDSGAAFRMRIHHDREQTLLERLLKDKSLSPFAKEAAARGLASYKREYLRAPAHTQAIARLCSRYASLSGTIRLLKKWFASHLLFNHIAEEVIELTAVRTFVQPWPWQTPSSVQTGFLRTLHWLARWDWRVEPLIVDLSGSGELKPAEVQATQSRFDAWRKLDPNLNRVVLFAASNVDTDGTTWTDGHPQRVVAGRMSALAKAACAEVEEKRLLLEPASLFASPLSDYDFVLHLNNGRKKRRSAPNGTTFKNLELAELNDDATVGFDTLALFLEELQAVYGSAILFFYGGTGRPVIAGLWSPQTAPRSWRVNLAYSTIPMKAGKAEDTQAVINKDAVLAEMAALGGDLIKRIEFNKS